MDQKRKQLQQSTRPPSGQPVAEADSLEARARELQGDQSRMVDSNIESRYHDALATQVEAKFEQAARIEDRLEQMIEQQSSRLQQCRARQPGIISLPGTRARWQQQLEQQQGAMQRLEGRLEVVRTIVAGLGLHRDSRIEELAERKLRAADPALAAEWDQVREAERLNLAHRRRLGQERERQTQRSGLSLGLSVPR